MPKISPKKVPGGQKVMPPSNIKKPAPPPPPPKKLPPLSAYGFATDAEILKEVRAHCEVLRKNGITLRMVFGCVNFLINESDRQP